MIEIRNISCSSNGRVVIDNVNLCINNGETVVIMGPAGSGKSAIIRMLSGLLKPDSGEIVIDGRNVYDVTQENMRVGAVFPGQNLYSNMTVIENLMLAPVKLHGVSAQKAYDNGMMLLHDSGLSDTAMQYPGELAFGRRQRISILRALAANPDVMLIDEPVSDLDPVEAREVGYMLKRVAENGCTMVMAANDIPLVRRMATRVIYIENGRIREDGSVSDVLDNTKDERARHFIKGCSVFSYKITGGCVDFDGIRAGIEQFCFGHYINRAAVRRIVTLFEEVLVQTVLPAAGKENSIMFFIEHADEKSDITVSIWFQGQPSDPFAECDPVSLALTDHCVSSRKWYTADDSSYVNRIDMTVISD